ncbi:MAG: Ig-like domain repeat protein [Isosphaeraceae bacterium]
MRRQSARSPQTSFRSTITPVPRRVPRRGFRPAVEQMEVRALLAAFTVTTTVDNGDNSNPTPGSIRQAILYANSQPSGDTTTITFDLPLNDPNHVYYADDGIAGSVTLADITPTTVDDSQISNMDPDWSHSWWVIQPPDDLPVITNPVVIDGYSQPGAQMNNLANGDDAILRVVLDGSMDPASLYCCPYSGFGLNPSTDDSTVSGLVIDNFGFAGILNYNPMENNVFSGNFIGTDVSGTVAEPNTYGIVIQYSQDNQVGLNPNSPADYSERNIISGNTQGGVAILDGGSTNNTVAGNFIGVGRDDRPLGNGVAGVGLDSGAQNNTVGGTTAGAANVIADNTGPGVWIFDSGTTGNRVVGNSIYGNSALGIDLGGGYDLYNHQPNPGPDGVTLNNSHAGQPGPNNWQNFPVLSAAFGGSATSVLGTLNSTPNTTFTIDFYANAAPDPSEYGQGQTWLGSASVTTDSTGNVSFDDSNLAATSPGEWISATATDPGGDTSEFCQDVVVNPVTASNLQAALNNAQQGGGSGSVTLQTTSNSDVTTAVQAINGVSNPNPGNPETITLDLDGGTYTTDTQVDTQPGVTLVITNGTLVGGSPALVVDSGTVVLEGVTALNATAAPTILVNGGSLIVRNSTIQESSGYAEAAISITGGTVDLGTASDPGGNTINVNGAGELVHNTTSSTVPAVGDTFSVNGVALTSPWLSFTSLASIANPSVFGQSITFTASVRPNPPGSTTPTGSVTFVDTTTGMTLGTASLSQGTASFTTAALATGNHTIAAEYGGDPNYMFSLDNVIETVHQVVTMTSVTASTGTLVYGQAVTFTATVSALSPSGATPTGGTVTFYDGSTVLGYSSLSGGIATLTTTSLGLGVQTISAVYSGDGETFAGSSSGTIATIAGGPTPGYSGDNGPATAAELDHPNGVAVDAAGDVFIADSGNNVVREIKPDGTIITVAGNGTASYSGDGEPATEAELNDPTGLAVDAQGNLYIADTGNSVIREVDATTGDISTVAGPSGLAFPTGVAVESVAGQRYLLIADLLLGVFEVSPSGTMTAVPEGSAAGDITPGVAFDSQGDLFISNDDYDYVVEVTPGPDGLPSDGTAITLPTTSAGGVAAAVAGGLFIGNSNSVQFVTPGPDGLYSDANVETVAGTGPQGYAATGGPAAAAELDLYSADMWPHGALSDLATDSSGDLFIADTNNNVVERVEPNAIVTILPATVPTAPATVTNVSASTAQIAMNDGQDVTFTATVTPQGSGGGTPTGTVQFVVDGSEMGGPLTLDSTGTASLTINPLSLGLGNHAVSAIYTSNSLSFAGSTGTFVGGETVYSTTTTSVIASSSTTVAGQLVELTATVSPQAVGGIAPTGTIQFVIDGSDYGAPVPIAGDQASITLSSLAPGQHPISAIFTSDSLDLTGSSSPLQVTTVGTLGDGPYQASTMPALDAVLSGPNGVVVDSSGDLFIADEGHNVVDEVTPDGVISTVVGTGTAGYSGDGGPAANAELNFPQVLAMDANGDLFIADVGNNVVREVIPGPDGLSDGTIITVAGDGTAGYSGNGVPATSAMLNYPNGIAVDSHGDLFIADSGNNVVREVTPGPDGLSDGTITTVAGNGTAGYWGDSGPATAAELNNPNAVAVNAQGDLFIADYGNSVVREVTPGPEGLSDGTITTFAGDGSFGEYGDSGDGGPATSAELGLPNGLAVDAQGNVFISDAANDVVRMVDPQGTITTVASGLNYPAGLALDGSGDLFIADQNNGLIRELKPGPDGELADGTLSVVAGGGPGLNNATGVAVDAQGDVFVADQVDGVVNEVTPAGITTTVVTGLNQPSGLAIDASGDLFIADTGDNKVLEVMPGPDGLLSDGSIITIAGTGSPGYSGDQGLAIDASLNLPTGLAVDSHGDLFISDSGNNVVREVTPGPDGLSDGTIMTIASAVPPLNPLGNGGSLMDPSGLAVNAQGDLFIADTGNEVVWEEEPGPDGLLTDGTMAVVAGNGPSYGLPGPDVYAGQPATQVPLSGPSGLAVDARGDLFIEDVGEGWGSLIQEVFPNGIITSQGSVGSQISYQFPPFWISDYNGNQIELQGLAMDAQGAPILAEYPNVGLLSGPFLTVLASPATTIATTTAVISSASTSVAGQSVTFTATVAPEGSSGGTPSGVVTFMDGNTALATESLSGGSASFTTSALAVGSHTITAVYSGDADFVTSTSCALTQQVDDLNTGLQNAVAAAQSTGGTVVLAATTTAALASSLETIASLPPSSAGLITVDLGDTTVYQQQDSSGNVIPIAASAPECVTLTIVCPSGSATVYDLQPSGGNVDVQGVPGQGSITIVGNSPALTVQGGNVTIGPGVTLVTETDSPTILVTGGSLTLRGAVVQESDTYNQAAIEITGGSVDLGTAASPGGNTFNVNGTGEFIQDTTSSPVPDIGNTLELNGALLSASFLSLTTLGSSAASSALGQPVTFTATVVAVDPTDGTPTGMVDFVDTTTGTDLGTATVTKGVATLTTSALAADSHAITADYEGDNDFAFSLGALTQTVNQATTSTTTTTVTSAASPSIYGQGVTFTATVTPTTMGSGTPAGTVQFEIDGADFGSPVELVNGSAISGAIETLGAGTHGITAVYSGNANFLTSTAADLTQVVNPAPLTVTANAATKVYGQSNPTFSASYSGFVLGQGPSVLGGTLIFTTSATAASHVQAGGYPITPSGLTSIDYAIAFASGTLTITLAPLTISANNASKVYGAPLPAFTASYSGLVNGDTPGSLTTPPSLSTTATAASHVSGSPYLITASGAVDLDYTISYAVGTLTVTPAALTITAVNKTKVYGAAMPALTVSYTGFVNGDTSASLTTQPALATNATAGSHVAGNPYSITASGAADSNYAITYVPGTLTITPASLTITANNQAKVYGQANPALTVSYAGFVNSDTSASLTTPPAVTTTATTLSSVGIYPISASGAIDPDYTINYVAGTLTINLDASTVTASATGGPFGQAVTFSATVTANAPGSGTPTGSVDFLDTTTGDDLGSVTLSGGKASLSTASLPVGSNSIEVTYSGSGNFLASSASTGTITINQSIIVLDPSAGGALSLSGSASINIAGGVYVDSSSSSALSAGGNASVKASVIDVHGGVQKSGNASFSPAPSTGATTVADPLASLASPSASGPIGSESLSGNSSATINPGIYSQITVSGNAKLTMNPGIYIIEGGGFSVSGNGSVSGTGVMVYNTKSSAGVYGSITLSGNGAISLTPPTAGAYAGILIFQDRSDAKALTFSGNALQGISGTIYAPKAQLAESGNAQLNAALIVDMLTISGNGVSNTVALDSPSGTVSYSPSQIRNAYGINNLALDGTGQTIAIVDAYDDPSIDQALDAFDSQFSLTDSGPTLYTQYGPASSFLTVFNQYGQATSLPSTDPNGPGTDNWEVEEALDVEWTHAIAPGARIILVEANSQSLSDLMAGVATAASQPGVSVVSMSWGFPEGQSVFAADEANYDSVFNVPGVTFVASTGDYGAADPEYPAFSPDVVAVGGTSLTINADNSYNSETGWGYYSNAVGVFLGSGGGISLYEPEPSFQQGVQSTGSRTTPDVSMVADPATGAWIADPYNLNPSDPFEVVGGTSLSSPAWAGLVALVNQGRVATGESTLNSSSPTETQQALYSLPQADYHVISSGNNGYSADTGYNLVTGLGTPVANLLVPDLVSYQGPGTSYSGPTVGPLQDATAVNTGASDTGPIDVFSVFDSLLATAGGSDHGQQPDPVAAISSASDTTRRAAIIQAIDNLEPLDVTDPQSAARFRLIMPSSDIAVIPVQGLMPLVDNSARDTVLINWNSSRGAATRRVSIPNRGPSDTMLPAWTAPRRPVLQGTLVDAVLSGTRSAGSLLDRDV